MYCAITLCCENINCDIPLFRDKDIIENVDGNINIIYKDIKKNEVSPNTDYLFDKVGKSNTEKAMKD